MKKGRYYKRNARRHNKFVIIFGLFIVCILFAGIGIGIKFTQTAKASSDRENKLQIKSTSSTESATSQQGEKKINRSSHVENIDTKINQQNNNSSPGNGQSTDPPEKNDINNALASDDVNPSSKVAYLTFDDGPSVNVTPKVLDILKQENVQATFFVIGKMCEENPELLKREKAEGHSIGNHTYSHDYNVVYSSPENFIKDIKKSEDVLTKIIGPHDTSLIRFPGGSFNRHSYKEAAAKAGYRYVDWNCLTGDAEVSRASVDRLLLRFNQTMENQHNLVILMHDAPYKTTTPEALPQIIKILKEKGYTFKGL